VTAFVHSSGLGWKLARLLTSAIGTIAVIWVLVLLGRPCRLAALYKGLLWGGALGPALSVGVFTHLRRRRWGRTVVAFFLTGGVALFATAVVVPNSFGAPERARRARAMADMREIGRQLEAGATPRLRDDPWGAKYVVRSTSGRYSVISFGECSEADVPLSQSCPDGPTASPECDLVYSNGRFARYPEAERP
jgi:hypothetical protein